MNERFAVGRVNESGSIERAKVRAAFVYVFLRSVNIIVCARVMLYTLFM